MLPLLAYGVDIAWQRVIILLAPLNQQKKHRYHQVIEGYVKSDGITFYNPMVAVFLFCYSAEISRIITFC